MDAQGSLDSLLGRLTTVLVNEAQLVGGVRGDVEFIKDEMESMNGLLLHLTEAQHRDHQVRAWMKQVVGLTRDCGGNVELYVHYVSCGSGGGEGLFGFLCRIPRFVRTVSVRRQIATRIRELKVRARDVGDRRNRYGVTVPPVQADQHRIVVDRPAPQPGSPEEEEELQRRELLYQSLQDIMLEERTKTLLKSLSYQNEGLTCSKVIAVHNTMAEPLDIARSLYQHPSVVNSFEHRAFVSLGGKGIDELCRKIMEKLQVPPATLRSKEDEEVPETGEGLHKLTEHLAGKKFIIVLDDYGWLSYWEQKPKSYRSQHSHVVKLLIDFLKRSDCSLGSSLIVSIPKYSPFEWVPVTSEWADTEVVIRKHHDFRDLEDRDFKARDFKDRTSALAKCSVPESEKIYYYCRSDTFALDMFLRLIYVSPNWPYSEMTSLCNELENNRSITGQIMLRFSYKDLPSNHKSCLLYLSIFPQDHKIRRTNLLRRWVAEGLVSQRSNLRLKDKARQGISTPYDESERIFDALVTRGFLHPEETSAAGKVKTFTVPTIVQKFIVGDLSYMDTCLPSDVAHRLSINNGVQLQEAPCSDRPFDDILTLLEQITGTVQWQLLKVLDLEGCRGLTNQHLENICKILLLKYLSLRDTDIKELPKQIEKLQCLETLDIRQTMVQAFSTKPIKLSKLKCFLAGYRDSSNNSFSKFKNPFRTVRLPKGIRRMKHLQVLSYVEVSDNVDDLNDVGQLLQLRKLGVILHRNKGSLSVLFRQIEKLHGCLRSLSIRINQSVKGKAPDTEPQATAMNTHPIHLQSLNISGITSGLPLWIAALDQLEEISLSETYLGEDAMNILGRLRILRCLKLLQDSYTQCKLNFKDSEFQQLRSLVVEGSHVNNISFDKGTTPKLRTIIWSFSSMEDISGLDHLPRLKKLELHGDCNLNEVKEALQYHCNYPVLKHNPRHQPQEDRTAAAVASSSSAA